MKRKIIVILAILMMVLIAFSGCFSDNGNNDDTGGTNGDTNGGTDSNSNVIYNVVINTSGVASTPLNSLADIVDAVKDSVVIINSTLASGTSAGSGVLYGRTEDNAYNFILTCHHVIDGATSVKVKYTNGETVEATVVGGHYESDIAVLKTPVTEGQQYVYATARDYSATDSMPLRVGEGVLVIGNPLGVLGGTVTSGIVSAMKREVLVEDIEMSLIQSDAAINKGNSGGAMFDYNGLLIGIVNAKTSGTGIEGLGYAIPVEDALVVSESLIETATGNSPGYVPGSYFLGVSVADATLSGTTCVRISSINADGCFYGKSLKANDYIVAIIFNGVRTEMTSAETFKAYFKNRAIGDTFTIVWQRSGIFGSASPQPNVDITLTQYIYGN